MKKSLLCALAIIPLLSGCVISVNDGDADAYYSQDWQKAQKENREYISNTALGTSLNNVKSALGTPDFTEAFSSEGVTYQVLFYATNSVKSDGKVTKDECTALVFKDGSLSGVGEKAYNALIAKV